MPPPLHTTFSRIKLSITLLVFSCLIVNCGGGGSSGPKSVVVANISLSHAEGAGAAEITFDGSGSQVISGNATINNYSWNFGDGTTANGSVVTHTYDNNNLRPFIAQLTVTDSAGSTNTASIPTTHSISGTISAASNTVVDIDVNDPSRQSKSQLGSFFESNDLPSEAQPLPNPVVVNGFASAIPELEVNREANIDGNFRNSIDEFDGYTVYLTAGQFASLQVADFNSINPSENDLDLLLYDSTLNLVRFSNSFTSQYESVSVPVDGEYFVVVVANSGISKYILSVGNTSLATGRAAYGQPANIIPGEAIVKMQPQISAHKTSSTPSWGAATTADTTGPSLVKLATTSTNSSSASASPYSINNQLLQKNKAALDTLKQIKQLNKQSGVAYAEPNYQVSPLRTPNDSLYPLQWHYPQINLPQAWDITTGTPASGNVIVAVVDTGVVLNHEDLSGQLVTGYDFISNPNTSGDGNGIDTNPNDPGDGKGSLPSSWHGTHVAGTIAAASNNNRGVSGVSWGAKIMPIRVLGQGGGTSYDVIQGVRYAAGLSNDSLTVPSQAASIINLSLGGGGFSQAEQDLFNQLSNAGIIVVAAAGNERSSTPSYPASYTNVISVSAVDLSNNLAHYSNFGSFIDVAAPGGDTRFDFNGDGSKDGVLSTLIDNNNGNDSYGVYQGTSMAAPHVSGVVALMKAVHPNLNTTEFISSLQNGQITNDAGASGRDNSFGYGIIDALKAVQQAQQLTGGTATGTLVATPNRIDFGSTNTVRELTITGIGNNPPNITSVTESLPWLNINDLGAGVYQLTADRSSLGDAIYSGDIEFALDNGKQLNVPVTLSVQTSSNTSSDAGFLYILLLDPHTNDPDYANTAQINLDISNGEYNFNFNHIPYGEYVIVAGSDVDNDFTVCSVGESCGSYPTLGRPINIVIDENKESINFLASVITGIINSASTDSSSNIVLTKELQRKETQSTNENTKQVKN